MDKFICIGKNYLAHAKELGDVVPEKPVLFLKPPSIAVFAESMGQTLKVKLPQGKGSVHHECEILLRLDKNGVIQQLSLGLDMTLRDVQADLKKKGHPWEVGKVFQGSAIVGPWLSAAEFKGYLDEEFTFSRDGQVKQRGRGRDMRFQPQACLDYAREFFPLCEGDVFFTGTPEGVGPVEAGQKCELRWGKHLHYSVQFE
jgi:2-keto-4-pentenoate hydratase/2-oxohepta-3-ene-1,7-dioic acid hydratase in catechol pathway